MKFQFFLLLVFLSACASRSASSTKKERSSSRSATNERDISPENRASYGDHPAFSWPTKYPYIQAYYGWRKRRMHEGLDLKAPKGTRVYATAGGEIIEAGSRIRGYGKTVVIDHGDGWSSIYAHLSQIKVNRGDHVTKGELVALSGRTGRATGPHLHFEIRKMSDPLDPLMFLPPVEGDDNDGEQLE